MMVVLKTHLESLISSPYLGLLVCCTQRTTITPGGVIRVFLTTLEDSIFIHLCRTPGLKFSENIIDKIGLQQLHFCLQPSLAVIYYTIQLYLTSSILVSKCKQRKVGNDPSMGHFVPMAISVSMADGSVIREGFKVRKKKNL